MNITRSLILALTQTQSIVLIVVGALFLLIFVYNLVVLLKQKKQRAEEQTREVEGVKQRHGVRYSLDMTIVDKLGDMNISFGKNDLLLKQNVCYIVDKKTPLKPGKYTILGTHEGEDTFNVRIGVYVKEYHHGQEIVLAEDEEITSVSANIILR